MSYYLNERPIDPVTDLNLIREQCGTLELALQIETDSARMSDLRRELAGCGDSEKPACWPVTRSFPVRSWHIERENESPAYVIEADGDDVEISRGQPRLRPLRK